MTLQSEAATTWVEYFARQLPKCHVDKVLLSQIHRTHSGATQKFEGDTIKESGAVISRQIKEKTNPILDKLGLITPCLTNVTTLYCEQDVVEAFYHFAMVDVQKACELFMKNILSSTTYGHMLAMLSYTVTIRSQHRDIGDTSIKDHYYVLEPCPTQIMKVKNVAFHETCLVAPLRDVNWSHGFEFIKSLETKYEQFMKDRSLLGKRDFWKGLPRMVLLVFEEKKPCIVVHEHWFDNALRETDKTSAKTNPKCRMNVSRIDAQIRKYSYDAKCPIVFLTDYLTTMLIRVKVTGITGSQHDRSTKNLPELSEESPELVIENVHHKEGPRALMFMAFLQRLEDTHIMEVRKIDV